MQFLETLNYGECAGCITGISYGLAVSATLRCCSAAACPAAASALSTVGASVARVAALVLIRLCQLQSITSKQSQRRLNSTSWLTSQMGCQPRKLEPSIELRHVCSQVSLQCRQVQVQVVFQLVLQVILQCRQVQAAPAFCIAISGRQSCSFR